MNQTKNIKVAIVDDDPEMTFVLTQVLADSGYEVTALKDGEEALKYLEKSHPDIVITDVMLPHMDGWSLCKKIKQMPHARNLPVVVLTAKDQETDQLMSYESGADEHIAKPFRNENLIEIVRQLTEGESPK